MFTIEEYFAPVSIIGREAFAVACLEQVCREWGIASEKMKKLIAYHQLYCSGIDLGEWEEEYDSNVTVPVWNATEMEVSRLSSELGYDHLPVQKQRAVTKLIDSMFQIATGNLYCGYTIRYTLFPLIEAANILKDHQVSLPDLSPFLQLRSTTYSVGWGVSIPYSFFQMNAEERGRILYHAKWENVKRLQIDQERLRLSDQEVEELQDLLYRLQNRFPYEDIYQIQLDYRLKGVVWKYNRYTLQISEAIYWILGKYYSVYKIPLSLRLNFFQRRIPYLVMPFLSPYHRLKRNLSRYPDFAKDYENFETARKWVMKLAEC